MNKCSRCGADLEPGKGFCPFCGARIDIEEDSNDKGFGYSRLIASATDHSREFDPHDIVFNKGVAALCYIGPLFLVGLICKKDSDYCRFHVNQGFVLFMTELIVGMILNVIMEPFSRILIIKLLAVIVNAVISVAGAGMTLFGVFNVIQGKAMELPVIGKIRIIK